MLWERSKGCFGRNYLFLGSVKWMRELGIYQEGQIISSLAKLGYTTVFLANEKEI
jgi:hypothetical protein